MTNYSIVRVGNDYVVRAEEQSILRIASKRMAVRLVAEASELLASCCVPRPHLEAGAAPSIARDRSNVS
jgi:hypothetical protein